MTTPKKISALVELTTPAVGDLLAVVDISEAFDADKTKKITTVNLGKILTVIQNLISAGYGTVFDNGSITGATTIDWTEGNIQKAKMTGDTTMSYTDPAVACHLTLILLGDGTPRTPTADTDVDCEWADLGEPSGFGDTNNEVVGYLNYIFHPTETPKYTVTGISLGGL